MKPFPHQVIRASAGTGKTFQLSNRYVGLLHRGAPIDEILAVTFTKKAAGEILERILVRLAEAALCENKRAELGRFLGDAALTQQHCFDMLMQVTSHLHRVRVGTLDSFYSQIASSFGLELGLPPGWRIVQGLADDQLRTRAIETILHESTGDVVRLMHLMTKGEADRSVSELIRGTVRDLYQAYQETEKSAWEQFPQPQMLTAEKLEQAIEAMANVELASKGQENARTADCQRALEQRWDAFLTTGIAKKLVEGETVFSRKEISAAVQEVYGVVIRHAKSFFREQVAQQTKATWKLLDHFDGVYREQKLEARALRFEDVTRTLAQSAQWDSSEQIAFRLDAHVSHLLLDEFQDTSLTQWRVIRPFAQRITNGASALPGKGAAPSFFCVGDVKQAIYGWRGGVAEIFDALKANLIGLEEEGLNTSFRSAPEIMQGVNQVFSKLTRHSNLGDLEPTLKKWQDQFPEHSTAKTELAGYVELATARAAEDHEDQEDLVLRHAADCVKNMLAQAPGASVGVLVRRNATVARMIALLRDLQIPASEEGGNPLTDAASVDLILALLKLADHPGDTKARYHVARSPLGPLLGFETFQDDKAANTLARQVRRQLLEQGYGAALHHWTQQLAPHCHRRDLRRLMQLVEVGYNFQEEATLRTTDFLLHVAQQKVIDPTTADVRVMTVHQSKGLQFDAVLLPELGADLVGQHPAYVVGQPGPTEPVDRVCLYRNAAIQETLPDNLKELFPLNKSQRVVEALCVLYVAMTRAVHSLQMVIAPSKSNEKNLPKTFAGLLRGSLTDGGLAEPGKQLYTIGKTNWFQGTSAAATPAPAPQPLELKLAPPLPQRTRRLERAKPSALEGGRWIKASSRLRLDSAYALTRGDLIHALFEQIVWLEDGIPSREALRKAAQGKELGNVSLETVLNDFYLMLQSPEITAALGRAQYASLRGDRLEVHNERGFALRHQGKMLTGFIDRLVLVYQQNKLVAAEVLDFKTDAAKTKQELHDKVEYYRPQIAAYRAAVSNIFRLEEKNISARLLFVGEGKARQL